MSDAIELIALGSGSGGNSLALRHGGDAFADLRLIMRIRRLNDSEFHSGFLSR